MRTAAFTVVGILMLSMVATAAPVITFYSTSAGGHTGTITYNPLTLGPAAIGTGIDIDYLIGTNTVANSGANLKCFSCTLSFVTGANISDTAPNVGSSNWTFAGGGSFQIYGGVDMNGNGIFDAGDIPSGTLLLTGTFSAPITVTPQSTISPDYRFAAATIINSLDNQLEGFFGNGPQSVYQGIYNQIFGTQRILYDSVNMRWRFNTGLTQNLNGMMDGFVADTLVPEPASVLLWGTVGAALLFPVVRRRRKAASIDS